MISLLEMISLSTWPLCFTNATKSVYSFADKFKLLASMSATVGVCVVHQLDETKMQYAIDSGFKAMTENAHEIFKAATSKSKNLADACTVYTTNPVVVKYYALIENVLSKLKFLPSLYIKHVGRCLDLVDQYMDGDEDLKNRLILNWYFFSDAGIQARADKLASRVALLQHLFLEPQYWNCDVAGELCTWGTTSQY